MAECLLTQLLGQQLELDVDAFTTCVTGEEAASRVQEDLEAGTPFGDGLARVEGLLAHPRYDPAAPNSVRAVLGGLAGNAPVFHATGGAGYRFLAARIAELDRRNPITASRLTKVFSRWRSYGPARSAQMEQALRELAAGPLSTNTREVVEQCLAVG
jgi:aminopeptidase N